MPADDLSYEEADDPGYADRRPNNLLRLLHHRYSLSREGVVFLNAGGDVTTLRT